MRTSHDNYPKHRKYNSEHTLDIPKLTILRKTKSDNRSVDFNESKKNSILNVGCNKKHKKQKKQKKKQGWYFVNNEGETKGPVSVNRLKILYDTKQLKKHHYVWNGFDIKVWTPLQNVEILQQKIINNSDHININNNNNNNNNEKKDDTYDKNVDKTIFFGNYGYKKDIFFVDVNNYVCGLCDKICRECVELSCDYGHLFCTFCIEKYNNNNSNNNISCPKCCNNENENENKNKKLKYHKIQYVQREIDSLKCKCYNHNMDCAWIGQIKQLYLHLKNECEYVYSRCDRFNKNILRKDYEIAPSHSQRKMKCSYHKMGCHKMITSKELNGHLKEYIIKHQQLQFKYYDVMINSHKYLYVKTNEMMQINGLYQRMDEIENRLENETKNERENENSDMKPIYKKQTNSSLIYIRFSFKYNQWMFENKKKILWIEKENTMDIHLDNQMNPCDVLFVDFMDNKTQKNTETKQTEIDIILIGFTDLYLFNQLNLLQAAQFIQIIGRKQSVNIDLNGIYGKQNVLHNGKPWYKKIRNHNSNNNDSKYQWVIRYFSPSELWLFDKRGLRNDDIANGIGHGDTISPTEIQYWEIHNGKTFVLDKNVEIINYSHT